jgi:NADH-quinone oxidoreductase subunit H
VPARGQLAGRAARRGPLDAGDASHGGAARRAPWTGAAAAARRTDPLRLRLAEDTVTPLLVAQIGLTLFVFVMLLNSAAIMVYVERKVAAFMQQRLGPYLVGPSGLLQPLADIVKLVFKEDLRPVQGDRWLFTLAPVISATAAFAAFAVVPFGAETTFFGILDEPISLQVADVNVAILVIFAIASMSVYGIVLAGWSSNSKYSLLGGLRSSAQMISYELSYGLALASVVLMANSLSLTDIVNAQAGAWFGFIPRWYAWIQPVGFLIFMVAGIAETNRAPFDFPEAEQELVAGYHTEYSSMRFALFFLAEYVNMVTVSAVATDLFLGGWHGPWLPESLGWVWFLIKVSALLFFYVWVRWTLPRYRYDQLMAFGWKILLPVATVNLLVTAAVVLALGL